MLPKMGTGPKLSGVEHRRHMVAWLTRSDATKVAASCGSTHGGSLVSLRAGWSFGGSRSVLWLLSAVPLTGLRRSSTPECSEQTRGCEHARETVGELGDVVTVLAFSET